MRPVGSPLEAPGQASVRITGSYSGLKFGFPAIVFMSLAASSSSPLTDWGSPSGFLPSALRSSMFTNMRNSFFSWSPPGMCAMTSLAHACFSFQVI